MEEIGIPELTDEQLEMLSEIAEEAARNYVLSKVPPRKVSTLNIAVETVGAKPVTISVDVDLTLDPLITTPSAEKLASEAAREALLAVESRLRELSCRSKT